MRANDQSFAGSHRWANNGRNGRKPHLAIIVSQWQTSINCPSAFTRTIPEVYDEKIQPDSKPTNDKFNTQAYPAIDRKHTARNEEQAKHGKLKSENGKLEKIIRKSIQRKIQLFVVIVIVARSRCYNLSCRLSQWRHSVVFWKWNSPVNTDAHIHTHAHPRIYTQT